MLAAKCHHPNIIFNFTMSSATLQAKPSVITPGRKDTVPMSVDKEIVDELLLLCGVIGTTSAKGNDTVHSLR